MLCALCPPVRCHPRSTQKERFGIPSDERREREDEGVTAVSETGEYFMVVFVIEDIKKQVVVCDGVL